MSFDADPFRSMELVIRDPDEGVAVRCSSCGAETVPGPLDTSVAQLLDVQHQHLRRSHRLTPEDTAGWSV